MGQGGNVLDGFNPQSGGLEIGGALGCEGGAFASALAADHTSRAPTDGITVDVGDGYDGIVEGGIDVGDTAGYGTANTSSAGSFSFSHITFPHTGRAGNSRGVGREPAGPE